MKINVIFTFTALLALNLYCSASRINGNNIKEEMQSTADLIKKDKKNIYKLDNRAVGNKGYFYIIRNNGTILYHPKKALINADFSRYLFVQTILKNRNGCLSFNTDGVQRYIFFREIDLDEILCLTIDISEFAVPDQDCGQQSEEKK